jgi:hypothetical protein
MWWVEARFVTHEGINELKEHLPKVFGKPCVIFSSPNMSRYSSLCLVPLV